MDELDQPNVQDLTEHQQKLQRMARRKGRRMKARANSKNAIRTWAEYSGVNLEPTGSYTKRMRWVLLFLSVGLLPALFAGFALHDIVGARETSRLDELMGIGVFALLVFAGLAAGLIAVFTFLRAVIAALQN